MYLEIFERQIYKFRSETETPTIIDCGANIGLGTIYFKSLYPNSRIIAFEPDPHIATVLRTNLASFGAEDVTVVDKAVWNAETTLEFFSEGSDAGRLSESVEGARKCLVETTRLHAYLAQPVDLLKIDIEGAETDVISDVQNLLGNVRNIFVEYHSFSGQQQRICELLNILEKAGFRTYIESSAYIAALTPTPFCKMGVFNGMDLQLNIFAVRDIR